MSKEFFMNKKTNLLRFLKRYGVMTLGCVIYALSISLFLNASHMVSGGVTGIAILINTLTGFDTGIMIIIINIPLLALGLVVFGKGFIVSSIYATITSSLMTTLFTFLCGVWKIPLPLTNNLFVIAVLGGVLLGAGMGLIFKTGSSTGGTDIVVKCLRKKFRHVKTGVISMTIDICIIIVAAVIFFFAGVSKDLELAFYAAVNIYVASKVFDWVLYGGNSAKLVYIIHSTDTPNNIRQRLISDLDLGATILDGKGAYSFTEKQVIMCVVKSISYPKLRDVVSEEDPSAFMIVTSAKEIYGENYQNIKDKEI